MPIKILSTKNAPDAIGPYSQGIQVEDLIFVSGQIGLISGKELAVKGNIRAQTERTILNIKNILLSNECGLENIIKTTLFLLDLNDFSVVNEVYGMYFQNNPPARSTVEVRSLPKGAKIEIEAIAYKPH